MSAEAKNNAASENSETEVGLALPAETTATTESVETQPRNSLSTVDTKSTTTDDEELPTGGLGDAVTTADASAIRVLVVPVGRVRARHFWAWTRALVRMGRIGAVRLQFVTRTDEHAHLEGLQTHRQVLGVVGVVDGATCVDADASCAAFAVEAAAHETAVAQRCVGYDVDGDIDGVVRVADEDDVREVVEGFAAALKAALHVMAATLEEEEEKNDGRRGVEMERGRMDAGGGRLQKLRGDVLLLAGRVPEALGAYAAAAEAGAAAGDSLWQAAAAEGYCAALVQVAAREPEAAGAYVVGMPGADISISEDGMAGVAAGVAELHERVPELLARCHAVAPVLHAEACVRAAQAVQAAHVARTGDAARALQALAQGRNAECRAPLHGQSADGRAGDRARMVAVWAGRAWDSAQALGVADQLRVAAAAGAVVGAAGFRRRAAFYLRQFVLRAVPVLMRAGRAAEAQTSFADGAAAFAAVGAQAAVGALPVPRMRSVPDGLKRAVVACVDALARGGVAQWPGLQADVLRACVAAGTALPSAAHAMVAATRLACCIQAAPALLTTHRALADEQHVLRAFLQRLSAQAATQGVELGTALPGLLVGVQHVALDHDAPPTRQKTAAADAPALFLHNPSAAPAAGEQPVLVAGECAWFVATLRNPLPFALVLSGMALLTDDDASGSEGSSGYNNSDSGVDCTVPTGAEGRVLLPLTPRGAAESLSVRGIRARVFQHVPIACELRAEDAADAARRVRARPLQQRLVAERRKLAGHVAAESEQALSPLDAGCVLGVGVAPALPRLAVAAAKLQGGGPLSLCEGSGPLSLYEGESRVVELALANTGAAAADWLRVEFDPVGRGDAHQQQRDIVDPALTFQLDAPAVAAHNTGVLRVRVAGLPGLRGACVVVRYGSAQATAWARELRWPLHVSVAPLVVPAPRHGVPAQYHDLPPHVVHALGAAASDRDTDVVRVLRGAEGASIEDRFCLAEIGVANVGVSDVRLDTEVDMGAGRVRELTCVVTAGAALAHVTVPLMRAVLDDEALLAPVPGTDADGGPDESAFYPWRVPLASTDDAWRRGERATRGRQFVVPRTALGDASARRAVYWTEQALASRVRMRWTCMQSGRSGFVDVRELLRVDARSLYVVRPRDVRMRVRVDACEPQRAGRALLQSRCAARRPTQLEITLANAATREMAPVVSVCVAGRRAEPSPPAVDAWAHRPGHVERLAAACVSLPGVPGRLRSRRFRFTAAPASSPAPAAKSVAEAATAPAPAERGLVLDDIAQLVLAPIAAGESTVLTLPMYVATPGRYHVDITIRDADTVVVRETLVIDS